MRTVRPGKRTVCPAGRTVQTSGRTVQIPGGTVRPGSPTVSPAGRTVLIAGRTADFGFSTVSPAGQAARPATRTVCFPGSTVRDGSAEAGFPGRKAGPGVSPVRVADQLDALFSWEDSVAFASCAYTTTSVGKHSPHKGGARGTSLSRSRRSAHFQRRGRNAYRQVMLSDNVPCSLLHSAAYPTVWLTNRYRRSLGILPEPAV